MIEIGHVPAEGLIIIRATGQVSQKDYERAIPELDQAFGACPGRLRALVILDDAQGCDLAKLWQELAFDRDHPADFARIAVLGNTRLEGWGGPVPGNVTNAQIAFFTIDEMDRARAWVVAD